MNYLYSIYTTVLRIILIARHINFVESIDPLLSCQKYSKSPQFLKKKKNFFSLSATHKIHSAFPIGTLLKRFMARKQHDYKSPIPISR